MTLPCRQEGVEPGRVDPAEELTIDLHRGPERAVAEAEDLLQRRLAVTGGVAHVDSEAGDGPGHEGLAAERLAGLRAADPDRTPPGRLLAEVLVEGDDAVDVGRRDVELLGDHRHRGARD